MPIIKDVHIAWEAIDLQQMSTEEQEQLVHQMAIEIPVNTLAAMLRDSFDDADREYLIHRMTMPEEEPKEERRSPPTRG